MLEHLSQEQIERYGRRTMPPAELLAVDDHLAACDACRQRLRDGEREQLGQSFASLQTDLRSAARVRPDHPTYEQLAAYLDNTLDTVDREIVESHLDLCAQCATEASDLRAFANQLSTDQVKSYAPPSLRDKFLAVWHWPALWTPLPLAGVAALLVTVGIAGLLVWNSAQFGGVRKGEQAQSTHSTPLPVGSTGPQDHRAASVPTAPGPLPEVVLSLNLGGGRQLTLDSQGQVAGLEVYPQSLHKMIQTVVATGRVMTSPALASLIGQRRTYRDSSDPKAPFDLLSPAGTVVRTETPTFRWQSWRGATGYTVQIFDSRQSEVERSPLLSRTEWPAARPLRRGETYLWQVTAIKEGEEHIASTASGRRAKFKVLEQAKAEELAAVRVRYADSPLILGILYAEAGLLDDAQRQFEALAEANRDGSPAARAFSHKLLADLQALRPIR